MWTMRDVTTGNELLAFESASTVSRENLADSGRNTNQLHRSKVDLPDE